MGEKLDLFEVGCRVRVVDGPWPTYLGLEGTVTARDPEDALLGFVTVHLENDPHPWLGDFPARIGEIERID